MPTCPSTSFADVFDVMRDTPQHTYQVLTKRSTRAWRASPTSLTGRPTCGWVCGWRSSRCVDRIDHLRASRRGARFLSCEPLLGLAPRPQPRRYRLGHCRRRIAARAPGRCIQPGPRTSRDQCLAADVAFFFKQWGGHTPKANGRELGGRTWDEMPRLAAASA